MNQWSKLKQILFQQNCMLCTANDGGELAICADCLHDLPWFSGGHCPQCGRVSLQNQICGTCLKNPPNFDATTAIFHYTFPVDAMLKRYKYQHQLVMAETFGTLLAEAVKTYQRPDILIPMPLHPKRLSERSFNQSLEISRIVTNKLNLKLDYQSIRRTRFSLPQVSLPYKQRINNMRGAFNCEKSFDDMHIALIDDVMTTGASLDELAKTLKKAGAKRVECWVVARTL